MRKQKKLFARHSQKESKKEAWYPDKTQRWWMLPGAGPKRSLAKPGEKRGYEYSMVRREKSMKAKANDKKNKTETLHRAYKPFCSSTVEMTPLKRPEDNK